MTIIKEAIEVLNNGELVAIPTETVYGLAAPINNVKSLEKIFALKERPFFDPLIIHVTNIKQAKELTTSWSQVVDSLTEKFWPGPLTIVLPKSDTVNDIITAGLDSVGLRCPNHPLALELLNELNIPLAAPSANKFKKTSPTSVEHVRSEFGEDLFILDGGSCEIGIESTVIGVFSDRIDIYRPGMITKVEIQKVVDIPVNLAESPVSPGQLKHHYMPAIPLIIYQNKDILIKNLKDQYQLDLNQSTEMILNSDPNIAARELYSSLREISSTKARAITLKKPELINEKWEAIWNRLEKAASSIV